MHLYARPPSTIAIGFWQDQKPSLFPAPKKKKALCETYPHRAFEKYIVSALNGQL